MERGLGARLGRQAVSAYPPAPGAQEPAFPRGRDSASLPTLPNRVRAHTYGAYAQEILETGSRWTTNTRTDFTTGPSARPTSGCTSCQAERRRPAPVNAVRRVRGAVPLWSSTGRLTFLVYPTSCRGFAYFQTQTTAAPAARFTSRSPFSRPLHR